ISDTSTLAPGASVKVPITDATPRASKLTTWPSMGSGLSGLAVVGLPVLIPALVGRATLNHNVADSCFQTSIVGAALIAFTAIVPVIGSHAIAARSPTASNRTCFTPPIHAE